MSSLFSSSSLQVAFLVTAVVLAVFVCGYFNLVKGFHTGYGMTLTRRESDGTVWVIAVLKNSPADTAGVKRYMQVSAVGGVSMVFDTDQAFKAWSDAHKPSPNKNEKWKVLLPTQAECTIHLLPVHLSVHPVLYYTPEFAAIVEGKNSNQPLLICNH